MTRATGSAKPVVSGDRPALIQDRSVPGGAPTLVDGLLDYEPPLL
jgi:hypothetical protein